MHFSPSEHHLQDVYILHKYVHIDKSQLPHLRDESELLKVLLQLRYGITRLKKGLENSIQHSFRLNAEA